VLPDFATGAFFRVVFGHYPAIIPVKAVAAMFEIVLFTWVGRHGRAGRIGAGAAAFDGLDVQLLGRPRGVRRVSPEDPTPAKTV